MIVTDVDGYKETVFADIVTITGIPTDRASGYLFRQDRHSKTSDCGRLFYRHPPTVYRQCSIRYLFVN